MKLRNVANVNTIIHGIILRETSETIRGQQTDLERDMPSDCDRDSRDGIRERECRVAVINPKMFSASPITIISVEGLLPELVYMLDTGVDTNLIKVKTLHPNTKIHKEDKLHIVNVTDSSVESFGTVQFSLT